MSAFVGAAQPQFILRRSDERINRMDFQPEQVFADVWAIAPASFATDWWPGGGNLCGDEGADAGVLSAVLWGQYDQAAGSSSRYGFTGVTRDSLGTAIGTCVVKLYRTSDDSLLDSTVSDPSGNFLLNTPYYPDTHYIVAHKTGSPDVDGVTQNTLIGA